MDMEQPLFDDLLQSLKEAKAIAKGEAKASRRFVVEALDVKAVREQIGLSQSEFADLMRVSIKTLQNWEQHRRSPTGPARRTAQDRTFGAGRCTQNASRLIVWFDRTATDSQRSGQSAQSARQARALGRPGA
jgi:putative transcriptional regulator